MKNLIIKFGLISSALIVGIPLLSIPILGIGPDSYGMGEIIGYSTIVVGMLLIVAAQYSYKKNENDGVLSFGEGFKMGVSIAAMGGMAFGIYNTIYVLFIEPDFNEKYFSYQTGLAMDSPEFQQQYADLVANGGFMYTLPGQFLLMFLTVFLIGFVISIVGALVLQSKQKVAGA